MVLIGIAVALRGTSYFWTWVLGLPTLGLVVHFFYRWKTHAWTVRGVAGMICLLREIDNWLTEGSLRNVRFLRQSLALFMAAFWLFATQHCGLESAGLLSSSCEQTDGMHDCGGANHSTDGCPVVESGTYKVANSLVKVSAPQLTECVCLICFQCAAPVLAPAVEVAAEDYAERPKDWIPVRSFEQRTALSPRAPSLS